MDGIVRAEVNADQEDLASARRIADLTAATMCRYASAAHKDPRAPRISIRWVNWNASSITSLAIANCCIESLADRGGLIPIIFGPMTTFASPRIWPDRSGSHLGYSDWLEITQERIDAFADATDDHQWIHVDPDAASAGPFGDHDRPRIPDLVPRRPFRDESSSSRARRMGVNYGTNKVRFVSPVPVGSKLRAGGTLASVEEVPAAIQATLDLTFEIEGVRKAGLRGPGPFTVVSGCRA